MVDIVLQYRYVYFGDTLGYTFTNSDLSSATSVAIVITNSAGTAIVSKSINTNVYGIATDSLIIAQTAYPYDIYTITATQGSNVVSATFKVGYEGSLLSNGIDQLLKGFLEIPVYDEVGIPLQDNIIKYTFGNWVYDTDKIQVRKNNEYTIVNQTVYPDTIKGQITTKAAYLLGDDYIASYRFRFFTEIDLGVFLGLSLNEINSTPPVTYYTLDSVPTMFNSLLVLKTYVYCLKKALLDIEFWNNRLIFPEPTGIRGTLNALFTSAIGESALMMKSLKSRRLLRPVGITSYRISTPYVLSGSNFQHYTVAALAYSR